MFLHVRYSEFPDLIPWDTVGVAGDIFRMTKEPATKSQKCSKCNQIFFFILIDF